MEKEYYKKSTEKETGIFNENEALRLGFDRLTYKVKVNESFTHDKPLFQVLCTNNTLQEGNLMFNPSRILRGHNVSNATNEEIEICLGMIKESVPSNVLFEVVTGKEIEVNFNWLTGSNLKYFKFFYIQLVDVLFKEFNFNLVDNRINKNNWDIEKNFNSEIESIKVFKMKGKHKLISLKVYPKSLKDEIQGIPKGKILMRMELTIHTTGVKSYFKANDLIELNQSITNFFNKLIKKLFLRLVDSSTGKIKRNNQRTKPLHEFLKAFETVLSTGSAQ